MDRNVYHPRIAGGSYDHRYEQREGASIETGVVNTDTTIVALGRRVASVESRLLDDIGHVYATASSTCLILDSKARAK